MAGSPPVVLVVEDERNLADLYSRWIGEEYAVRTAYDGEEALTAMAEDVAVVLLDRRMPGLSGDDFLERVRERGYDASVAVVSAVEPDFDVLEMGFDDYVTKPVDRQELLDVVERLLLVRSTLPDVREYYALAEKRVTVEAEKDESALEENREYAELLGRIDAFETRVVALAEAVSAGEDRSPGAARSRTYRDAIEAWEARRAAAADDSPRVRVADEVVERYERALASAADTHAEAEREFLGLVADGFLAEGFWLDGRILRALNVVLPGTDEDTLVVADRTIEAGEALEGADLHETSEWVRELADEQLASLRDDRRREAGGW